MYVGQRAERVVASRPSKPDPVTASAQERQAHAQDLAEQFRPDDPEELFR
jgi:hypothetical protein